MKNVKWIVLLLSVVLLFSTPFAVADDYDDDDDYCSHDYVRSGEKQPTCTEWGRRYWICSICGDHTSKKHGRPLGHNWSELTIVSEATCLHEGSMEQKCSRCGAKRTVTIDQLPHTIEKWEIVIPVTDHSSGQRQGVCKVCNTTVTEDFDPEGTLRNKDEGEAVKELNSMLFCRGFLKKNQIKEQFNNTTEKAVKKLQEAEGLTVDGIAWPQTVSHLGHQYSDWNVISVKSDFSIGEKERTCALCGYTVNIVDSPSPILKRKDKGDGVKALQEALNNAGYACGSVDGQFGGQTERAVKAFEKDHGLNEDGIAWPGVLNMIPGIDITDCYTELLSLDVSVSPEKEYYQVGEKVILEWTIAKQSDCDCKFWRIDCTPSTGLKDMMIEGTLPLKENNNNSRSGKYEIVIQADSSDPETCSIMCRALGLGSDDMMLRSEDIQVQLKIGSN